MTENNVFYTKRNTEVIVLGPAYINKNGRRKVSETHFKGEVAHIGEEMDIRFDDMKREEDVRRIVREMGKG